MKKPPIHYQSLCAASVNIYLGGENIITRTGLGVTDCIFIRKAFEFYILWLRSWELQLELRKYIFVVFVIIFLVIKYVLLYPFYYISLFAFQIAFLFLGPLILWYHIIPAVFLWQTRLNISFSEWNKLKHRKGKKCNKKFYAPI